MNEKENNIIPAVTEEAEEKVLMTYEDVIMKVLEIKDRLGGTMPNKYDYEKLGVDTASMVEALGLGQQQRDLGVSDYAVINIAVLRELRRRQGQQVYIGEISRSEWIRLLKA